MRAFVDKYGDITRCLEDKGGKSKLDKFYINYSQRIHHNVEGRWAKMMRILATRCREESIQILTYTPANKVIRARN